MYEFTATDDTAYFFGLHLVSSDDYRYVLNAHGDVVALVSKTGSTVAKYYEYDAFGNEINPDASDTNPYRYCGEYYDFESGTIYLRARYYSPVHGRFTQVDSARDGINWYAYCGNNPIAFVDPSGKYYIVKTGNGTFSLVPANILTSIGSAISNTLAVVGIEYLFNVVGGNSSTGMSDINKWASENLIVEALANSDFKDLEPGVSAIFTINSIGENEFIRYHDEIAFKLFSDNGISTEGMNKEQLDSLMSKTYDYIDGNWDYFGMKIDGKNTLYDIDTKLSNSDNITKTFNGYVNQYKGALLLSQRGLNPFINIETQSDKIKHFFANTPKGERL